MWVELAILFWVTQYGAGRTALYAFCITVVIGFAIAAWHAPIVRHIVKRAVCYGFGLFVAVVNAMGLEIEAYTGLPYTMLKLSLWCSPYV